MKTVMSTWAQRSIRATVLMGLLGSSLAGAQEYPPNLKAPLIASSESAKTLELKDGRIFTFRQLVELPESERKTLLKLYKNRSEHSDFRQWELTTAEARLKEAEKGRAAAEAEGRRLDKGLAAAYTEGAKTFQSLAANTRGVLAFGKKLPISFTTFSKSVTTINDDYLKAGLSKEDADFLKSLLKRPELFEKP
jgi:hypothetical protein